MSAPFAGAAALQPQGALRSAHALGTHCQRCRAPASSIARSAAYVHAVIVSLNLHCDVLLLDAPHAPNCTTPALTLVLSRYGTLLLAEKALSASKNSLRNTICSFAVLQVDWMLLAEALSRI
eukprot:21260-Heterococcus_DN1.PRE.1